MARYAIGDIQGCLPALKGLLKAIAFNPDRDQLWLVGDLICRGDDSLGTLRYLYQRRASLRVVLGNHDLHLLAHRAGAVASKPKPDIATILAAADGNTLCDWLQQQPLVIADKGDDVVMSHAGIPPMWSVGRALQLGREVSAALHSESAGQFFQSMYGNKPALWRDDLSGYDRLRCITNYLTRMRCLTADGALELKFKGAPQDAPAGLLPWYKLPPVKRRKRSLIFGHWAALGGLFNDPIHIGMDTACVWGGPLSALDLDSGELTQYQ